jgi:hypothetical protein
MRFFSQRQKEKQNRVRESVGRGAEKDGRNKNVRAPRLMIQSSPPPPQFSSTPPNRRKLPKNSILLLKT